MTDKKTLEEAATLTINTEENGMAGSLTINANDEADLVQIIKRAGLDKIVPQNGGNATLTVTSPDGKISTNVYSPDIRSIMALLRMPEEELAQDDPMVVTQPGDLGMDGAMGESAEVNDYAAELSSRKGEVYPGSDSRPGTARAPTIPTPAKSGDNPLAETRGFKDYLQEVMAHQYPRAGDMRPVNLGKYRGDDSQGWGVSRFQETGYGSEWIIPAWDEEGNPDLTGPFADEHAAQAAIDAAWAMRESINETTGKNYTFSTCLSFGTDGEADYREIDVKISYSVVWGSPETAKSYMMDPASYDPGSASEIEDIAILEIDGQSPMTHEKNTIDAILAQFESNVHDEDLLANAADIEDSRRPDDHRGFDEGIDEASNWDAKMNRYGKPMFLLPTQVNCTFDEIEHTEYCDEMAAGKGTMVVVGKMNGSSGAFTPRYCASYGDMDVTVGEQVTIVHDQNHTTTPGKVLFAFSGADYMNNREAVAQGLEQAGVSRRKRVPLKVFK